jgi:hypothetical protein
VSTWNDAEKRAEFCAQMREFVDLVESNPLIPTPTSIAVWSFLQQAGSTQAERFNAIHDFAEAFDVPVHEQSDSDRQTAAHFGPIELTVHAYSDRKPKPDRIVTRTQDAAAVSA